MTVQALLEAAGAWRDDDPDPGTRHELSALITAVQDGDLAALSELRDRFTGLLQFGTAGLRGARAAGPNRMNRAVVIRAAAGLVGFLAEQVAGTPRLVVGYDARHQSQQFALDTCAVAVAAGCTTLLLPRALPTPVLAFAVRHLAADAGVMVTASHNPPQDNGYKVYLGGAAAPGAGSGVQIVPPADRQIAAAIAAVTTVAAVPRARDGWQTLTDELVDTYVEAVAGMVQPGGPRDLAVVLTPLHGVGGQCVRRTFTAAGFVAPHLVAEQAEPDPDFPTVAFPNPEEPGAIDLAVAAAQQRGADVVIANDPDADRCAVAVPLRGNESGAWRMLRGDQVGALLAEHVLARRAREGQAGSDDVVACSIVSSQLLAKIAAAHGVRYQETLTGFKWIARVPNLVYGYEEALGYCVAPNLVRDKDGVSAALLVAELAATFKAQGRTLLDALDDLEARHGVHATDQLSVRVDDLAVIAAAMVRLRAAPPSRLGGHAVVSVQDLLTPVAGTGMGGGVLPATDGLRYRTDGGVRVVVRPSGTEPKLKCYLEAVVPVVDADRSALAGARATAARLLAAVRADLALVLALD